MWVVTSSSRKYWALGRREGSWVIQQSVLGPWLAWASKRLKQILVFVLMMVLLPQVLYYGQEQKKLEVDDIEKTLGSGRETKEIFDMVKNVIDIIDDNIDNINLELDESEHEAHESLERYNSDNKNAINPLFKNENESKYSVENIKESGIIKDKPTNMLSPEIYKEYISMMNRESTDISKEKKEKCSHLSEKFLELCPVNPPGLIGPLVVLEDVSAVSPEVSSSVLLGGSWSPRKCTARYRVAIIVPYRDRENQVLPFLQHMHGLLQRQQLNYTIFFVTQNGNDLFNRAKLLNTGYTETRKTGPWDCYVFHDVDMLPENDHNLYHCTPMPKHMVVSASNKNYEAAYKTSVSGANSMTDLQILAVNGWSNRYWGWGGEDDDMWRRITAAGLATWRYPLSIGRYKMIIHKQQEKMELAKRQKLLAKSHDNYKEDGLNTLKYTLLETKMHSLCTTFVVDIGSSAEE